MSRGFWRIAVLSWCLVGEAARAQDVTVQQPVVSSFSAATTVSVPDRGRAFIGGVGSAGSSRSRFGPLPSGTNSGQFATSSNLSAHVFIHDFEAMDRAVLEQAAEQRRREPRLAGRSEQAYRALLARHRERVEAEPEQAAAAPASDSAADGADLNRQAELAYQRGLAAERRGAIEVARVHYRVAQKAGSQAAAARLKTLSKTVAAVRH